MKIILLDENLPVPLKNDFSDSFEVLTVYDKGWQSKKNGGHSGGQTWDPIYPTTLTPIR
jgi:hypothetical protein